MSSLQRIWNFIAHKETTSYTSPSSQDNMSGGKKTKILIICGDSVDANMGGVGVRNWEIAKALSNQFDVTLAIPNKSELAPDDFKLISFDLIGGDLRPLAQGVDTIILHGFVLHHHPYLQRLGIPLAVDLYVPFLLESLVWHDRDEWANWDPSYEEYARVQGELLRAGDFFFCASERQRDYWLGWMHAQKRINPRTYRQDHSLRALIDIVPFGLPADLPRHTKPVLKGVLPGIGQSDKVMIWSGGLWDWLDPLTVIQAMARLRDSHPELKLFFMGTRHPNPIVNGMEMPDKAVSLSQELGLYNQTVFFGDWTPYAERGNYLAEADLSVLSHPDHIETHFSFRTRVLDCIWAGLPMVITAGDEMSKLVEAEKIGYPVPTGDVAAMADAIAHLLDNLQNNNFSQKFDSIRQKFAWDVVTAPLKKFCLTPVVAPDKGMYLTEVERISHDKDAFLHQVIQDKDNFLQAVIRDKDQYFKKVVDDRDTQIAAFNETVDQLRVQLDEKNKIIEHFHTSIPLRIYFFIRRIFTGTT